MQAILRCFPGHEQGAGPEVEQPGYKSVLRGDLGIASPTMPQHQPYQYVLKLRTINPFPATKESD